MGTHVVFVYGAVLLGIVLLVFYALRKIDKGTPGWGGPKKEEPEEGLVGPGPCPKGPVGMKGPSGEVGE